VFSNETEMRGGIMPEWFSGEVIANGIKIHYWRTGGEGPPVVFSHGITDNGLCWTRLARALEDVYDVIMPDARGHGFSDAPDEGYAPGDQAADLAGLIQALGLIKPRPVLIGHSMGAATTAAAAADYPELVRCAILEDPPWMADALAVSPQEQGRRVARRPRREKVTDARGNHGLLSRPATHLG
jgi:N-formylmaleamate deformylase